MTKLTDSQLIVLSRAVQREDGVATLPETLKGGAAAKVAQALIDRKLMREVRAKIGMPAWRRDEDERAFSLIITRAGRKAINADDLRREKDVAATTVAISPARFRRSKVSTSGGSAAGRVLASASSTSDVLPVEPGQPLAITSARRTGDSARDGGDRDAHQTGRWITR